MATRSAGLLMYRRNSGLLEVLLVHPGGPLWARRDEGAWTFPKGEYDAEAEDAVDAAKREFTEETGFAPGSGHASLGEARQRSGKLVCAWAFEGDCDPAALSSNSFELEWPPRSGRIRSYPEADRAAWFTPAEARVRILPGLVTFIDRLEASLRA
ncbi:NUDIX hydrolase [Variovorax sp. JS1663]|nr:NUDIX hydrolase [Variovorax sp. JS1663]